MRLKCPHTSPAVQYTGNNEMPQILMERNNYWETGIRRKKIIVAL